MKLFSLILTVLLFATVSFAQEKIVETEFKVSGVCGECKERIEKAVKVKDVKFAKWNKKTHMLKVAYDSSKLSEEDLRKLVAAVGHDTETVKASAETYAKLPGCCKYRDGVDSH